MFKKINAVSKRSMYVDFNSEKEFEHPIEVDYLWDVKDYRMESRCDYVITQSGNCVCGCFVDIYKKDVPNPAIGFFLESKNKILFNGEELKENTRKQITEKDEIILLGEDMNCLLYPIVEDADVLYYIDYKKDENTVGIIGSYNGIAKPQTRFWNKFGCAFSTDFDFIKDNADLDVYPVCSISALDI